MSKFSILATVLTIALTACGGGTDDTQSQSSDTEGDDSVVASPTLKTDLDPVEPTDETADPSYDGCGYVAVTTAAAVKNGFADAGCDPTRSHEQLLADGYIVCGLIRSEQNSSTLNEIDYCGECFWPEVFDGNSEALETCSDRCSTAASNALLDEVNLVLQVVWALYLDEEWYSC